MAVLDNENIVVGDSVYDVVLGSGSVHQVRVDGTFVVNFPGRGKLIVYSALGTSRHNNMRTLYWHNPIVLVPAKAEQTWVKLGLMFRALANIYLGRTP
jgi:hypothetical protein